MSSCALFVRLTRGAALLAAALCCGACETDGAAKTANASLRPDPNAPAAITDGKRFARQIRALDALLNRGDRKQRDEWLAQNAPDKNKPVDRFLQSYGLEDRRVAWKELEAIRRQYSGAALGYLGIQCIYVEWKLVDEAQKAYEQAVGLDPTLAVAHARMGNVLMAKGSAARAQEMFDRALALDPEDGDALLGKARLLKADGKSVEALALYKQAVAAWPESLLAAREYAETLEAAGMRKEAASAFLVATRVDPRPYATFLRVGALLAQEGDRAAAEEVYKNALQHNPNDAQLLTTLGKLSAERGDKDGQLAYFARAVEGQADDVELHRALAVGYQEKGEMAGAERHLLEVIRLQPEDGPSHLSLARLYSAGNKYREAMEHYEAAARTNTEAEVLKERDALRAKLLLKAEPATGKDVTKVFNAALKTIIAAYESRIKEVPDLVGGVTVVVDVGEDGAVKEVTLKEDSLKDEVLVANIYFTIKNARFPPGKKARYTYPISFAAGPARAAPAPAAPAPKAPAPAKPKRTNDPSALGGG